MGAAAAVRPRQGRRNYILTSATEVKHGDTVGKDAEQKIVVHHGRSTYLNGDVYKILTP